MKEKSSEWPDINEVWADVDIAFEEAKDEYKSLNIKLLQVWFRHGLLTGNMICGVGGSLGN